MKKHAVGDLEEAAERNRQWEKLTERLAAAEKSLSDELAGESLADLTVAVAVAGELAPARGLQEVTAELAGFENQEKTDRGELADLRRQIGEWETAWTSLERLVLSLAAAKGKEGDLFGRQPTLNPWRVTTSSGWKSRRPTRSPDFRSNCRWRIGFSRS